MDRTDELIERLIENAGKIQKAEYGDLDELFHFTKAHLFPKNIADLAEAFGMMAVKLEAREIKLSETIRSLLATTEELRKAKSEVEDHARTLELKVSERTAEIMKLAATDELTGLLNRREVLRMLGHVLSRRDLGDLAVVFFDIDHFKDFNDTYGHQVGDEVLKLVGRITGDSVRESDLAGRYGGEEFLVVLPDGGAREARIVVERIRRALAAKTPLEGTQTAVTASFGIVALGENMDYVEARMKAAGELPALDAEAGPRNRMAELLLKTSDQALYKAKNTSCLDCGFESEKAGLFTGDACPTCKGSRLDRGRNRVKEFVCGSFV